MACLWLPGAKERKHKGEHDARRAEREWLRVSLYGLVIYSMPFYTIGHRVTRVILYTRRRLRRLGQKRSARDIKRAANEARSKFEAKVLFKRHLFNLGNLVLLFVTQFSTQHTRFSYQHKHTARGPSASFLFFPSIPFSSPSGRHGLKRMLSGALFRLLCLALIILAANGDCSAPSTPCSIALGDSVPGPTPSAPLAYDGRLFYQATIDVEAIRNGYSGYDLVSDPGELISSSESKSA